MKIYKDWKETSRWQIAYCLGIDNKVRYIRINIFFGVFKLLRRPRENEILTNVPYKGFIITI